MPIGPIDVAHEPTVYDQLVYTIDQTLANPTEAPRHKIAENEHGFIAYRFFFPGTLTEKELQKLRALYMKVGWHDVLVENNFERLAGVDHGRVLLYCRWIHG